MTDRSRLSLLPSTSFPLSQVSRGRYRRRSRGFIRPVWTYVSVRLLSEGLSGPCTSNSFFSLPILPNPPSIPTPPAPLFFCLPLSHSAPPSTYSPFLLWTSASLSSRLLNQLWLTRPSNGSTTSPSHSPHDTPRVEIARFGRDGRDRFLLPATRSGGLSHRDWQSDSQGCQCGPV